MCYFRTQEDWSIRRRAVGSYLGDETSKDKERLLNPTPLEGTTGYIMEDAAGDRYLKNLPQKRLNLIDGHISSCCYILNSPERLVLVKEVNELTAVICDI